MRSHPTGTPEGRAALRALVRDPRVLSEALRAMARRASRRRQAYLRARADATEARVALEAMQSRARALRDRWADHPDQTMTRHAAFILGEDDNCEHCGRWCICGRLVDESEGAHDA